MLYDKNFLKLLDEQNNKIIYGRITALNLQEWPIETIEGRITQGSINIDGSSAVRRTCSLTMVTDTFHYSSYLWSFNTKFKLEIGVENNINSQYDNIIWFNQGIYVISSFNTSRSTNSFNITIQGKDKMSRLNGDVGGVINSSVDFGTIEEEDTNGNWIIRKIPIKEIIRNAVHQYGDEPLHNIIINDVPDYGYELLEYRYDVPMYLYRIPESDIFQNATLDGTIKCVSEEDGIITLDDMKPTDFDMLIPSLQDTFKTFYVDGQPYIFAKIEYGQTAGYRETSLTYAGDLIANIGETVTSVLDKIKNMLGEFEYFYDLDGHFVFQKKQSFTNTIYGFASIGPNESPIQMEQYRDSISYYFNSGKLTTSFNYNPNIANLKNDYSIWGQRNTASGAQVPVHLRYAIDQKPIKYTTINVDTTYIVNEETGEKTIGADYEVITNYNSKYGTQLTGQKSVIYHSSNNIYEEISPNEEYQCDWREVIYHMALDYYKYGHLDDFEARVAAANPHYPSGITGYEQYYIDLQGFWRDLYDPESKSLLESKIDKLKDDIAKTDNDEELKELKNELEETEKELEKFVTNYYTDQNGESKQYWNKNVYERPEVLNFWFDFLDTSGELDQFNVKIIGHRAKAINDTNIKAIYFKDAPEILFVKSTTKEVSTLDDGKKRYIQVPQIEQMFSISAQGISAHTRLQELIYQHGYCSESITINCIPIYYLQPNTKIHVFDEKTHISGDYVIDKITIPLAHNGTMSITATKASEYYLN